MNLHLDEHKPNGYLAKPQARTEILKLKISQRTCPKRSFIIRLTSFPWTQYGQNLSWWATWIWEVSHCWMTSKDLYMSVPRISTQKHYTVLNFGCIVKRKIYQRTWRQDKGNQSFLLPPGTQRLHKSVNPRNYHCTSNGVCCSPGNPWSWSNIWKQRRKRTVVYFSTERPGLGGRCWFLIEFSASISPLQNFLFPSLFFPGEASSTVFSLAES